MKRLARSFCALILVLVFIISLAACKNSKDSPPPKDDGLKSSDVVGSYEGEWVMSPAMKPLASLQILEGNKYEFYVSIMGLVEEGTYTVSGKDKITFTSSAQGAKPLESTYAGGVVSASFTLGSKPTEIKFTQVGSPDDVYKEFLGDYLTKAMGNTDVLLRLLPGKKYEVSLSKEKGSFKISNGTITLTPEGQGSKPVSGTFNLQTKEIKINMSVSPGTPSKEYVFNVPSKTETLVYTGTSTVGMSGSTAVKLTFKKGGIFEMETTKPRGTGTYKITESGGKFTIELTYTDPAKRPDGSPFIMKGTASNKDISAPGTTITIDPVEYIVNMEGKDSIMNLNAVTFKLSQ